MEWQSLFINRKKTVLSKKPKETKSTVGYEYFQRKKFLPSWNIMISTTQHDLIFFVRESGKYWT